jgi:adenylate cyclase
MSEGRVERRLTAILAADVAGYSRLIGEDEEGTLAALRTMRGEVIDTIIAEHRGRIVKTTGDGLLAEFQSVVDALRCAAAWQVAVPTDSAIAWRIGVHQGDIVAEDGDIFGDGVNVAARLEALAEPGGICVSARVQEDAVGRLDLVFEDLGEQRLKNIARRIRVYRARTGEPRQGSATGSETQSASRLSIVVLPLVNLSSDPEQEYFVDAITDDLTTDLSRIVGSFVIARTTAFAYKGKAVDVKQIGQELGVRYVLEGSVRRMGEQVQVNVQLIDAESGGHLWADRFDTDRTNLAKAQGEITPRLARALQLELLEAVSRRIEQDKPENVDVRDLIMRGWALHQRPRQASDAGATLKSAHQAFAQALAMDPESIDARVGVAWILGEQLANGLSTSREVDMQREDDLLSEALERDRNNVRAVIELGRLRRLQGRLRESSSALEKALSLDPNHTYAIAQCGITTLFLGRPAAALPYFEKWLRIDPRRREPFFTWYWLGHAHLLLYEFQPAIEYLTKACDEGLDFPGLAHAHLLLTAALALQGDIGEGRSHLDAWVRRVPKANSVAGVRAWESVFRYTHHPEYGSLREKTVYAGLRCAGMSEE